MFISLSNIRSIGAFQIKYFFVFAQATLQSQHNVTGGVFTLHDTDLHEIVYLELFITPVHYFEDQSFLGPDCAIV